jgi:carbamoyltransferase
VRILGLSAFYHDSAACLIEDGRIIAAAQEERFTRKKHDPAFPKNAVEYCLKEGGLTASELDYVAFYDKPLLTFERLLTTYLAYAPKGYQSFRLAIPEWMTRKLWTKDNIRNALPGYTGKILFTEHHESHAASAFFPSPFEKAAILTLDGVGEWATSSITRGQGNTIEVLKEMRFPHSIGMLYSAFTYYTGFRVNSGEYKVMGLAPYGKPRFAHLIYDHLIELKEDGSFKLNQEYFDYCAGLTMTSEAFHSLFGEPPRKPESRLTQRDCDLAASVQVVCEDVMLRMAKHAMEAAGSRNLCLAGGVALNCVGNGRILREAKLDNLWVQPAAGDAGGALGAASYVWHQYLDNPRTVKSGDSQAGSLLGPEYSDEAIGAYLEKEGIPHEKMGEDQAARVAQVLADGAIIGWFQGRMEYGPRSLGARSILGDPRNPEMQTKMNLKIKFRESFRPFAPAVLADEKRDYFDLNSDSPYMLIVAPVKESRRKQGLEEGEILDRLHAQRSDIPAITHVDYSARVQTVGKDVNKPFHALLTAFREKTGCGVLVNTSFNVRGEPIVCQPHEAYTCFMRTDMDYLVLGSYILDKKKQPQIDLGDAWKEEFVLD